MTDLFCEVRQALAGRYTAHLVIGRGATSIVYLAMDLKHDRPVAIKVLRPETTTDAGIDRFLHEIRIVAQLQHPNILPLYDSGTAGDLLYYVMPHVEGGSLREKLNREGRLSVPDALLIVRSVGCALDYAHRKGVIHRDVKPENVLLLDGQAVVADFGIAIAEAEGKAVKQECRGTPEYMSPEQAIGGLLDRRTDIYGLACVFYEMLAGRPPFTGPHPEGVLAAQSNGNAVSLIALRPDLSTEVFHAVARALAKAPDDRFPTMREFIRSVLMGAGVLEMRLASRDSGNGRSGAGPQRAGASPHRWSAR